MKIIGVIILLTVLLVIGVVGFMSWSEKHSNEFQTYQEAQESEIITRGWIPSFIPPSSYNIKEHHRVDNPTIFVEFDFTPEDISYFKEPCNVVKYNVYKCNDSGNPVKVTITNDNHAIIESI